jgi:hypothetical protein
MIRRWQNPLPAFLTDYLPRVSSIVLSQVALRESTATGSTMGWIEETEQRNTALGKKTPRVGWIKHHADR